MTTIGIIGAGNIGGQVARAAVRHGYDVVISNSRGPETLAGLVAELGPKAQPEPRSRQQMLATSSSSRFLSAATPRSPSSLSPAKW